MNYKKYIRAGKEYPDEMPLYANSIVFNRMIDDFCEIFKDITIDKVAGVEAAGFIFASAVAAKMDLGVILLRKKGLQRPVFKKRYVDYTNREKELSILRDIIKKNEKILIVDDWVDTGGAVETAISLIEKCGGQVVGIGALMDISSKETRDFLSKYNYHYLEKASSTDKFLSAKSKKKALKNS
jgi:adenine phosphoribosyltransferase